MRKLIICLLFCLSFQVTSSLSPIQISYAEPLYAKWGKLAVEKTKEHYPNAEIIDYKHIGRVNGINQHSVERFKLILKENQQEFGVLVNIEYDKKTDSLIKVTFKKVKP